MLRHIKGKKFLPLIILIGLAVLAGGTNVFSDALQNQVVEVFRKYLEQLVPMSANIFAGLLILSLMYVLYDPLTVGVDRALAATSASNRGKVFVARSLRLAYWVGAVLIGVSFIAPGFFSKIALGVGLLGAALTLALQGLANDLIAGVMLSFSPKVQVGDDIELVGLSVKGKVSDIGYVMTVIQGSGERFSVPNREIWSRAVRTSLPKSSIIRP
ncbi:MAG: mechanosensitive ion channel family protein [Cyanobacteria bacterium HKST-UBA02]|nr:mechanosensitive ion channel family protein [Cyanobacteria bacterium HKST-UBA02]